MHEAWMRPVLRRSRGIVTRSFSCLINSNCGCAALPERFCIRFAIVYFITARAALPSPDHHGYTRADLLLRRIWGYKYVLLAIVRGPLGTFSLILSRTKTYESMDPGAMPALPSEKSFDDSGRGDIEKATVDAASGENFILSNERDIATHIISVDDDSTLNPWTFRAMFIGLGLSTFGGVLGELL